MKAYYKKKFGLTDKGAEGLAKSTLFCFLNYCSNMLPAFILMIVADQLILSHVKSTLFYIVISITTLIVMYYLLSKEYSSQYNATYKESADLRMGIADTLSKLPLAYFSKHDLSDVSQTIMSDVDTVEHAMSHAIPKVGGMVLFFPVIGIMLLAGNIKMGLAVLIPTLVSFILIPLSKNMEEKEYGYYYSILRENSELFQETIELQQEINSFNLSRDVKESLYKKMEESEKIHMNVEMRSIEVMGLSSLFAFISIAIVIMVGINLILAEEIDSLYLIGYLFAAIKIKELFDISKEGMIEMFFISSATKRIKEMRDTPVQKGKDVELETFDVEFKNVFFEYREDNPVLNGISFTANQNEVTALVGASGCGKTSILRLVSRLYDYDKGDIFIGSKNIKEVSTDSLFSKVSIVFQDVTLFNSSIRDNIRIGRRDATDEEVYHAAKLANCLDFVESLPDGFDTIIGENGAKLSGGERQRISIARAFLKNAPILLLDEISANLDVDNEKKIQESLNKLIQNKTVMIISHRLKSIENVDKIVVIDKGVVENCGTHDELLKKSKLYHNLIQKTKLAEEFVY